MATESLIQTIRGQMRRRVRDPRWRDIEQDAQNREVVLGIRLTLPAVVLLALGSLIVFRGAALYNQIAGVSAALIVYAIAAQFALPHMPWQKIHYKTPVGGARAITIYAALAAGAWATLGAVAVRSADQATQIFAISAQIGVIAVTGMVFAYMPRAAALSMFILAGSMLWTLAHMDQHFPLAFYICTGLFVL
ncbi:MAG: hypothetical protein RLZZ58_2264, partial [Pseudomonadota bacterium]